MEQYLIFILINNDRKISNSDFDLEVILEISGIIKNDREDGVVSCLLSSPLSSRLAYNCVDCWLNIHNCPICCIGLVHCKVVLIPSGAWLFFELLGAETVRIFNLLFVHCSLLLCICWSVVFEDIRFIKFKIGIQLHWWNSRNTLQWTCAFWSCFDTLSGARLFFELLGAETVRIFNLLFVHCSLLLCICQSAVFEYIKFFKFFKFKIGIDCFDSWHNLHWAEST